MKTQKHANWFNEWNRWTSGRHIGGTEEIRKAVGDLVQEHVMGEYVSEEMACNVFEHADWEKVLQKVETNQGIKSKGTSKERGEHAWHPLRDAMLEAVKNEVDRVQGLKRGAMEYMAQALNAWGWLKNPTSPKGRTSIEDWCQSNLGLSWWMTGARSDARREAVVLALLSSGYMERAAMWDVYSELRHPLGHRHHKRHPSEPWSAEPWPTSWEEAWRCGEAKKLKMHSGKKDKGRVSRHAL
jgi:hypothetical protein